MWILRRKKQWNRPVETVLAAKRDRRRRNIPHLSRGFGHSHHAPTRPGVVHHIRVQRIWNRVTAFSRTNRKPVALRDLSVVSAAGGARRGNNGQITERDWFPVGPGESGYTIPDPLDADVVYNAGPGGSVVRLSKTTGQVRDISPAPVSFESKYRFNWTIPMAFSPQDPHLLYLGTQFLLKTTDAGTNWEAVSGDLTRVRPDEKDSKQARGTILTIAPSEGKEGVIWVGTDDGNIQLTKDAGKSWQNVTPSGVSEWSTVSIVEASHFDAGTAYAAVNRNNHDDLHPHIFRTRDFGKT